MFGRQTPSFSNTLQNIRGWGKLPDWYVTLRFVTHCMGFREKVVNPSVPDSLTCFGPHLRQIGTFRPLRRECTRLRLSQVLSQFKKLYKLWYLGFWFFWIVRECVIWDVLASNYDRKTNARPFDTIHDIPLCLGIPPWEKVEKSTSIIRTRIILF